MSDPEPTIRRLADGSIDTQYYMHLARRRRSDVARCGVNWLAALVHKALRDLVGGATQCGWLRGRFRAGTRPWRVRTLP